MKNSFTYFTEIESLFGLLFRLVHVAVAVDVDVDVVLQAKSLDGLGVDALVVVSHFTSPLEDPAVEYLNDEIHAARALDASFAETVSLTSSKGPVHRVIYAPIANLSRDYDDVRRYADATADGLKRASATGAQVSQQCHSREVNQYTR